MVRLSFCSSFALAGLAFAAVSPAYGQTCTTVATQRVQANYTPDPNGAFVKIVNWVDYYPPGGPDIAPADPDDLYNFTDCVQAPAGSQSVGPPLFIADPTMIQIGSWFYITGTSGSYGAANFPIYRTQDFCNFQLHMLAFAQNDQNVRSGQYTDSSFNPPREYFGPSNYFTGLWAPQMYRDLSLGDPDPYIYMTFSAVNNASRDDWHSCFHVRIRQSKFVQWLSLNPLTSDGPRFADPRDGYGFVAWYGYKANNGTGPYLYDGGYSVGGFIPAGGGSSLLGTACGQLEQKNITNPCNGSSGTWSLQHRCVGSATWMVLDPFVFIDPQLSGTSLWKRTMLYNWDGRGGTFNALWGNNIAAAPLRDTQFLFDAFTAAIPMATSRNTTTANRVLVSGPGGIHTADNGTVERNGQEWCFGAVAEGACAFYSATTNRYYLIYSRNTYDSPSYQLVYRMTDPGQPFTTIKLPWFDSYGVNEYMLLESNSVQADGTPRPRGVSFGHCEVTNVQDCGGVKYPVMIFHCKIEGNENRTVFFKELNFETDGRIKQLYEYSTDNDRNIHFFKVPYCKAQQ